MNIFRIRIVAGNPRHPGKVTAPLEALVDTGTDLSWLPAPVLWSIGVTPRRQKAFDLGFSAPVVRSVGDAIIRAHGHESLEEVVFAEPGERVRLGVRALESFGIQMDDTEHRFIGLATLAAFNKETGEKTVVKFSLKLPDAPAACSFSRRAKSALVKGRRAD